MKITIIYILILTIVVSLYSCSINTKKNTGMMSKFAWDPSVACPENYPVEIKYGYVGFGKKGERFPIMQQFAKLGIGIPGGGIGLNDYRVEKGFPVPNSLEIVWASYTEKKFYKAKYDFPEELQEKILELFRQEFYDCEDSTYYRYDNLVLTLLPHGIIWLSLTGPGRYVCLDHIIQAEEVKMEVADFVETRHKTMDEFCSGRLSDYPKAIVNLEKNGIPAYHFWERYAERFRYKIKIEFEDPQANLDPDFGYDFTNGEYFRDADRIKVELYARIRKLIMFWSVDGVLYTGFFYFNEDEVMTLFAEAYRENRNQPGEFIIKVGKYNNWFDIFLRVGGKEYKFELTKIHVFSQGISQRDRDAVVFYNNHSGEHSSTIKFVGE